MLKLRQFDFWGSLCHIPYPSFTLLYRYDWHQTGPYVYISIYAKTSDPEKSYVEANETNVSNFYLLELVIFFTKVFFIGKCLISYHLILSFLVPFSVTCIHSFQWWIKCVRVRSEFKWGMSTSQCFGL